MQQTTLSLHGRRLDFVTPPSYQVSVGSRVINLFGEVEFIVDYNSLRLHRARREDIEDILCDWGAAADLPAAIHQLTALEGRYVVTIEEKGQVIFLYTSNDCNFLLYYASRSHASRSHASRNEGIFLSTDWTAVLQWLGRVEISKADLASFMIREWTDYSHTIFKGLYVLQPYGLYTVTPTGLSILKHAFPGLHTVEAQGMQEYEISEYVSALGAYAEHFNHFALAFSGGTDSRVLAHAYRDKLKQLLTIMYEPPFMSHLRYQSGQASQKLAQARGIQYTPLKIDWTDSEMLNPYLEHFMVSNPFSTHLNAHYYHLATQVDSQCDVVMAGTCSDIIWGWGLYQIYLSDKGSRSTSSRSLGVELVRMLKRGNPRHVASYAINRYGVRWAMVKSFKKPRLRTLINHYQPFSPQFEDLWQYPYKLFALRRFVEWSPAAETTLWDQASQFSGKRVILPYTSPLALHVGSQIPRRNLLDLKAPLREIYGEYDASIQDAGPDYPADQKRRPYSADVFHQPGIREWNQQYIDAHSREPFRFEDITVPRAERTGFYHLHLNHLFRHAEQRLAAVEVGHEAAR